MVSLGQGEGGCSAAARCPRGRPGPGDSHPGRERTISFFHLAPFVSQDASSAERDQHDNFEDEAAEAEGS